MDFTRQYIVQSITSAANNLRLSSEKIETVAILKERLTEAPNISDEIQLFKKITELSKLGIKLSEIFNSIEGNRIDFAKLSEKFKEQSYGLVRELSNSLDNLTPQQAREVFSKGDNNPIKVDLTKKPVNNYTEQLETAIEYRTVSEVPRRSKADELKEEIIMGDLDDDPNFNFEKYEAKVLRPVKELDPFLNRVSRYDFKESEIRGYIKSMNENAELSKLGGYEILSSMHTIFARGLELINLKKIAPSQQVIESLRACLIVIVAVVRGKEVDITSYLNRAETFGRTLSSKPKGN